MICHKCTNSICKAYHGTCRRFRLLRFITFGKYGKEMVGRKYFDV